MLPTAALIKQHAEDAGLALTIQEDFGRSYAGLPPEKWSSLMYGLWPDGGLKDAKEETYG